MTNPLADALRPFAEIALVRDVEPDGVDAISAPDLAITPRHIRNARAALAEYDAKDVR